jgi:hypothetical protein
MSSTLKGCCIFILQIRQARRQISLLFLLISRQLAQIFFCSNSFNFSLGYQLKLGQVIFLELGFEVRFEIFGVADFDEFVA